MKPAIPLTDKRFVYVDAANTDIRVRFNKERARLAKEATQRATHLTIFEHRRKEQRNG